MERPEISGIDEQNNSAEIAINEQQGPVDPAHIDAIRATVKAVVEVGSDPTTHPLRKGVIRKTAPEIAEIVDSTGQPVIDRVVLFSVTSMDGRE